MDSIYKVIRLSTACHLLVFFLNQNRVGFLPCDFRHFFHLDHQVTEHFLNVYPILGWCLEIGGPNRLGKFTSLFMTHFPIFFQILFISYQNLHHILPSILLALIQPILKIQEWLSICNIKNEDDAIGPFVVGWGNCLELLLASSIPQLKFNHTSPCLDGSDFKIDSNGGEEVFREDILGKSHEETGFANSWVANQENFEDVIILCLVHCFKVKFMLNTIELPEFNRWSDHIRLF